MEIKWSGSLFRTTVSGFPNLFLMTGPNTGLGHSSMIYMIESQSQYITQCIRNLKENKLKYMDVKRRGRVLQSRATG